ncbi:MAG: transposase [Pseudomonadales bacterium]
MAIAEDKQLDYLFKLRKSKYVKELLYKHHSLRGWDYVIDGWEVKESELKLMAWSKKRRVVMIRRRLPKDVLLAIENNQKGQKSFGFLEDTEDFSAFEYAVFVTSLKDEKLTIVHHYRDRADCENNFDEIKNHWGWGGFTTHDIEPCRLIARITALIYNWWNIFTRLVNPDKHMEAITSRPLLLSSVGRLTEHSRQKKMTITNVHAKSDFSQDAFQRIQVFFNDLKANAPQLSPLDRWYRILSEAMKKYLGESLLKPPNEGYVVN